MGKKLTQKWCIVTLLEDIDEGVSFFMGEWLLHITIAGVHDVAWNNELIAKFEELTENFRTFNVNATEQGALGTTAVILIDKNSELIRLHSSIIDFLEANGAVFNNPEWQKDGYLPHSTVQKHASVAAGQTLTINNVALVDMFPNQDGNQRKITKMFNLKP